MFKKSWFYSSSPSWGVPWLGSGSARLALLSAFGWLLSGLRLDFGLDFGWISVWLSFTRILAGFDLIWLDLGWIWLDFDWIWLDLGLISARFELR